MVRRLHQTDVAFLDQIEQREAPAKIALRDRHHETRVRFEELTLGLDQCLLPLANGLEPLPASHAVTPCQRAECTRARCATCHLLERFELLIEPSQHSDDVVNGRGANRQLAEHRLVIAVVNGSLEGGHVRSSTMIWIALLLAIGLLRQMLKA